jgi:BASS family bile acid:Na+ symporter
VLIVAVTVFLLLSVHSAQNDAQATSSLLTLAPAPNHLRLMKRLLQSVLFWLVVSTAVAFFWPGKSIGWDPFTVSRGVLWALIVVTMFSLGTLVRAEELKPLRSRPWWVILGAAAQVIVMPLAAWLVTWLVPMDPELAAGVILCGCVPGAMASNVLTHTAGGSVAFSVSLTTVATLLSPLTVPAVLAVVTGTTAVSSTETALTLALLVAMPTVLGYVASRSSLRLKTLAVRWSGSVASVALLWIIASVVAANRDKLQSVGGLLIVALLLMNLIGYAAGYLLGRGLGLPESFGRALSLEVGMQNAGLGTALAVTLYGPETLATIPTAAYTFGCMLTGTMLAIVWRQRDQSAETPT